MKVWMALLAAASLQACSGGDEAAANDVPGTAVEVPEEGGPEDGPPQDDALPPVRAAATPQMNNCAIVPAVALTGDVRRVTDFGATPNDNSDDTAAIQRALDATRAGQTLVFPAGRYLTNRRLRVRNAGVTLQGAGAVLHATNPDDQALMIEVDNVSVYSFTFTAVTDGRRTAPWHSRIAVYFENPDRTMRRIRNTVIQGNKIEPAANASGRERAAGSAGGIMLLRADRFLVANNKVARTLADGIHITAGSTNGRVISNVVRENGDDMIAVVSYAGSFGTPAALSNVGMLKQNWGTRVENQLNRNILIRNNDVAAQYWGRGISVVGGESVTIHDNRIHNTPLGAAVLLAREANYESFGVRNVLVQGNTIGHVQTDRSPFDPDGTFGNRRRTGHGAIEMHASVFQDEANDSQMREELSLRTIKIVDNYINVTAVPGVRAGVGFSGSEQAVNPANGAVVSRPVRTGVAQAFSVQRTFFENIPGEPMSIMSGVPANAMHCKENVRSGQPYSHPACTRAEPSVQGASLACSADGRLL